MSSVQSSLCAYFQPTLIKHLRDNTYDVNRSRWTNTIQAQKQGLRLIRGHRHKLRTIGYVFTARRHFSMWCDGKASIEDVMGGAAEKVLRRPAAPGGMGDDLNG